MLYNFSDHWLAASKRGDAKDINCMVCLQYRVFLVILELEY